MESFAHPPATIRIGDLEVPRLGFGAMQIPGPMVWGEPKDPERVRTVLKRVVALGIQLIDTSWYYGPYVSNRFIAETLYPYPKGLVIATKLGGKRTPDKGWAPFIRPDELRQGCDEDLKGLRLERIDIVHLRWLDHGVPFAEALDAMIELQKQGKIRHLALSNVSLDQIRQALEKVAIVGVQNLYNVAAESRSSGSCPTPLSPTRKRSSISALPRRWRFCRSSRSPYPVRPGKSARLPHLQPWPNVMARPRRRSPSRGSSRDHPRCSRSRGRAHRSTSKKTGLRGRSS